jgi:uncharacterized membrane protein
MNIPTFSVHGGGDPSGGLIAIIDDFLGVVMRGVEQGSSFQLLPGIAALSANVHPMVVHFPIALLSSYFLMDVWGMLSRRPSLRYVARWLLYLGAIGAIAAVAAGLVAAEMVPHGAQVHEIMETHERLGFTVAGIATGLAVWRRLAQEKLSMMANSLQLLLGFIMLGCMTFGADLGGLMVYRYGVGVHGVSSGEDLHHHHGHAGDGGL